MAANPDPQRITDAIWRFWEAFKGAVPSVRYGGIYASKTGYHNTRNANPANNYSVRDAIDKLGPGDKAAAIDLTFPDAQAGDYRTIARYSNRLLVAGRNRDARLYRDGDAVAREFYGNADLDVSVEGWDFRYHGPVSSDSSHLWHIHISFTRKFVNDWTALSGVLAVLLGREEEDDMELGDSVKMTNQDGNRYSYGDVAQQDSTTVNGALGAARGAFYYLHRQVVPELAALRGQVSGLTVLIQQLATQPAVPLTPEQLGQLTTAVTAAAAEAAESALERTRLVVDDT